MLQWFCRMASGGKAVRLGFLLSGVVAGLLASEIAPAQETAEKKAPEKAAESNVAGETAKPKGPANIERLKIPRTETKKASSEPTAEEKKAAEIKRILNATEGAKVKKTAQPWTGFQQNDP